MKKLMIVLALVLALAVPVLAAGSAAHLVDDADLLTPSQEQTLETKLQTVSDELGMDIVAVTTDDTGYKSSMSYADDFFDYGGYGKDGILLLIDMDNRQIYISTTGKAIDRLPDDEWNAILDEITPMCSAGEYYDAVDTFADLCVSYCSFNWFMSVLISLGVGLVIAFIATSVMKGQLKSVHAKAAATDYVKPGSLQVTEARDLFLYRNVTRTAKPKESSGSSTHTSSSGRSHGGGGRSF